MSSNLYYLLSSSASFSDLPSLILNFFRILLRRSLTGTTRMWNGLVARSTSLSLSISLVPTIRSSFLFAVDFVKLIQRFAVRIFSAQIVNCEQKQRGKRKMSPKSGKFHLQEIDCNGKTSILHTYYIVYKWADSRIAKRFQKTISRQTSVQECDFFRIKMN